MTTPVAWLRERLLAWMRTHVADVRQVRGMRVVVSNERTDITTADVLARLDEALALIERFQPARFRHLRRDLREIRVARFPCRGAYLPAEECCITELTFLARRDIPASVVASSILHEGVHARVDHMRRRLGGAWREEDRAREERLCRQAEVAFGRALPAALGAPVLERALATLAMADADVAPAIDWNLAAERQAAVDAGAAPPDPADGR